MPPAYNLYEPCSVKTGLIASAKSIYPGQTAQSAQADMGRYFLLLSNFHRVKGLANPMIQPVLQTKWIFNGLKIHNYDITCCYHGDSLTLYHTTTTLDLTNLVGWLYWGLTPL